MKDFTRKIVWITATRGTVIGIRVDSDYERLMIDIVSYNNHDGSEDIQIEYSNCDKNKLIKILKNNYVNPKAEYVSWEE